MEADDLKTHEFKVAMSCEGCSAAVNRVLGRLEKLYDDSSYIVVSQKTTNGQYNLHGHQKGAVKKIEFDMDAQKVFVKSSLSGEELLAIIKKTGRECSYVGLKK